MNPSHAHRTKAKAAIAGVLGVAERDLIDDSAEPPPWDSLTQLNIILAVEEACGVRFPPDRIPELTDAGKLLDELDRLARA
ncbi:MAG: acyl carrier protein [Phycisphaerae bacterium]